MNDQRIDAAATDEAPSVERPQLVRSFEGFYRSERDRLVRALALTLGGDVSLAAEATDEAMARAYTRWRQVGGYENPSGWVYRVALNWARSRLRKRSRERWGMTVDRGEWDPDPADPTLVRRVWALPEHQRVVVVLRYFTDWSTDQIADALDIRPGTVKSRLNRALSHLRTTMEEQR
jgi:RNA polymerase sigma-70 factor (ECF subfamily)